MPENTANLQPMLSAVQQITTDMQDYHPKALVLLGSLARYWVGDPGDHPPNDIDLLVVTNNIPFSVLNTDYGYVVELHTFMVNRIVGIAKSLRYDSRLVALAKLYGRVLAKKHSIDVIAAAMMLGSGYTDFGIEQIELDGITDTRDYSIHRVLMGKGWWTRLCRYASKRRGPWLRLADKIAYNDGFEG